MSFRYWLDSTALRSALLAGAAALAASCGGDNDLNGPPDPPDPGDPPAVDAVALDPTTVGLAIGQKSRLIATVHAADGTVLTDRTVTWSSRDAGIATVADGEVTAVTEGSVEITATSEGKTGLATVTVFGEGDGRTRTWKGDAGGAPALWSRAANWTPSGQPIPLDTAVIAAADVEPDPGRRRNGRAANHQGRQSADRRVHSSGEAAAESQPTHHQDRAARLMSCRRSRPETRSI